jgi:hypothetical protein
MTESGGDGSRSVKAVYGQITWGTYDQTFVVDKDTGPEFNCQDAYQTRVQVADFDPKRYQTIHPVNLTCTATGRFPLTGALNDAFSRISVGRLPEGSLTEDEVKRRSYRDGVHHSYSLPFDQYPVNVQDLISEIYRALRERASHVWRLLRWRTDARGSHEFFQTILACEWSTDGKPPWHVLALKGYGRVSSWAIPRLDVPVVSSVQALLTSGIVEPTSEELLREAWAARGTNPRAGLLLAVAAAEVGFKELVIDLVPEVRWLTLNVQSPPLVKLLSHSLSELPVRQGVGSRPPQEIRKVMEKAITARNGLAHQGKFDQLDVDLYEILDTVRSLLRQFAYYRGFRWITPVW